MRAPAFTPEWLTDEVSQALAGIAPSGAPGRQPPSGGSPLGAEHVAKKEATVLRLAEALANGVSMNRVFERPDTCSKRVWYGHADKPGWRDDPAITTALAVATERARWWVRVKRGRAVEHALEILVDGAEAAALQLTNLVRYGYVKFDYGLNGVDGSEIRGGEVREVLAAAQDLLDRVSELTAQKSGVTHTLNSDQFGELLRKAKVDTAALVQEAEGGWDEDSPAPT